ncbi:hypothetical protein [Dictyobacter kobayashii]|uniref:Uncharacterized protein n=1 Tax=Dictyobacter kobayashii TaxID=2014872 RepID=A0A402ACE4_9CHLR|nr:hypothetical protein [Dictyobacter kobayashii]GCE16756.1 hypothetical protein KDK_05560 [Dictyobacter kobayashii]
MKSKKLSEIADIIMGQSPSSSSYNLQGQGLPFFQGKADFGDLYPRQEYFVQNRRKLLKLETF